MKCEKYEEKFVDTGKKIRVEIEWETYYVTKQEISNKKVREFMKTNQIRKVLRYLRQ